MRIIEQEAPKWRTVLTWMTAIIESHTKLSWNKTNLNGSIPADNVNSVLQDMAKAADAAVELQRENEQLKKQNEQLKKQDDDQIAIIWHIKDVQKAAEDMNKKLSDEDCQYILAEILYFHDANIGVSWETIRFYITKYTTE
tara:strand:- start:2838 stop:3260 length:423 start_codon:yes stop_codon:yes gene_type:complete